MSHEADAILLLGKGGKLDPKKEKVEEEPSAEESPDESKAIYEEQGAAMRKAIKEDDNIGLAKAVCILAKYEMSESE